jgi:hypothetical protein
MSANQEGTRLSVFDASPSFIFHRARMNAGPLSRKIERIRAERIAAGLLKDDRAPAPVVAPPSPTPPPPTPRNGGFAHGRVGVIQRVVAEYYGLNAEGLLRISTDHNATWPKQVAMAAARSMTDRSYTTLAKAFRLKDHTTVHHGVQVVARKTASNPDLALQFREVCALVRSALAQRERGE